MTPHLMPVGIWASCLAQEVRDRLTCSTSFASMFLQEFIRLVNLIIWTILSNINQGPILNRYGFASPALPTLLAISISISVITPTVQHLDDFAQLIGIKIRLTSTKQFS